MTDFDVHSPCIKVDNYYILVEMICKWLTDSKLNLYDFNKNNVKLKHLNVKIMQLYWKWFLIGKNSTVMILYNKLTTVLINNAMKNAKTKISNVNINH